MATIVPTISTIITRPKDSKEIEFALSRFHRLVLIGQPGIGKTTLLRSFWADHIKDYYADKFVSGFEINTEKNLDSIIKELTNYKRSLLIIDGYDEILDNQIKEELLRLFKESRKYGMDIILSSRTENGLKQFQSNSHTYHLHGLTARETEELFEKLTTQREISPQEYGAIKNIIKRFENSPVAINEIAKLFNTYSDTNKDIIEPLTDGVNYESKLFAGKQDLQNIITPERKKIITEIKVIEKDLVALMKKNPADMYKLTSRQFEEFIAELYQKNGFSIVLTKETRDGGKDFIITNKSLLGDQLIYGECKRNRPDRPVGVGIIRELHSTIIKDGATAGIVISSSYFSNDAQNYANDLKHQMSLVDYVKLNKMIQML